VEFPPAAPKVLSLPVCIHLHYCLPPFDTRHPTPCLWDLIPCPRALSVTPAVIQWLGLTYPCRHLISPEGGGGGNRSGGNLRGYWGESRVECGGKTRPLSAD
jgi:hypothetical protein